MRKCLLHELYRAKGKSLLKPFLKCLTPALKIEFITIGFKYLITQTNCVDIVLIMFTCEVGIIESLCLHLTGPTLKTF